MKRQIKINYSHGFDRSREGGNSNESALKFACHCGANVRSNATTDLPIVVSVEEAAHLLSLGRTSIFRLLKSRQLASFKSGRRRLVVRQSVIDFVTCQLAGEQEGPS